MSERKGQINSGKRLNPFFSLVNGGGLTLQIPFHEKIILQVGDQKIQVYLMSVGSNQASMKFVCAREVRITRENFVDHKEVSNG